MVFGYFNNDFGFLPTPDQILYGIILAQIDEFKDINVQNFNRVVKT